MSARLIDHETLAIFLSCGVTIARKEDARRRDLKSEATRKVWRRRASRLLAEWRRP